MHEERLREQSTERKNKVWYLGQVYARQGSSSEEESGLIDCGLALAPEEWMNRKLEELGFTWRVKVLKDCEQYYNGLESLEIDRLVLGGPDIEKRFNAPAGNVPLSFSKVLSSRDT